MCPICGKTVKHSYTLTNEDGSQHRCSPKTLARIDAARGAEVDRTGQTHRTLSSRFADGFLINSLSGDSQ